MSVPNHRFRWVYPSLNAFVTVTVLVGVFLGLSLHRMPGGMAEFLAYRVTIKNFLLLGLFLVVSGVAFCAFGLSSPQRVNPLWKELAQITKACTVASAFALLFPLTTVSGAFTPRAVGVFFPVAVGACLFGRIFSSWLTVRLAWAFQGKRDLIIVGSGPRAEKLHQQLCRPTTSYTRVLGFVDSPAGHLVPSAIKEQTLGTLEELEAIVMRLPVDEVLIALPAKSCYAQIQSAIAICERSGVEVKYLSDIFEVLVAKPRFEPDGEAALVSLKMAPDDYRLFIKRTIDVLGAVCGLILFAPLMVIIAAAIKIMHPGPVLFAQERYGLHKRRFVMYKFRTMVPNAEDLQAALESQNEAAGPVFKICNDPRITPIGRILRKRSLDELPQLFNVLWGDMSLVGPRPLPERDVSRFEHSALMRRFSVKPGVTCLWQVNGRSNTAFDRWITLDLKYIDEWSLGLDFKILVKTVPCVLKASGAV